MSGMSSDDSAHATSATNLEQGNPPEIEAAYKEAKERGLPDGWTCTIDKRKRRKWTAPNNGKSCDSIPKALAISVELGLLPPDTVIPAGGNNRGDRTSKKKKGRPKSGSSRPNKRQKSKKSDEEETTLLSLGSSTRPASSILRRNSGSSRLRSVDYTEVGEEDLEKEIDESEMSRAKTAKSDQSSSPDPMDPEITLEVTKMSVSERKASCLPTTVHWDPNSPDGKKIGWKVKIMVKSEWHEGRVIRYDPCTHKHKVQLDTVKKPFWIWLRNKQHNIQVATRLVWALVKGYAWWPALVMETNSASSSESTKREGFVTTEFFGTGEIASLRDSEDTIRPFDPHVVDPVVQKHRKKRNQNAFELACEESRTIRLVRNKAVLFYARAAFAFSSYYSPKNGNGKVFAGNTQRLTGRRVKIFRNDVNYPYGDTVVGVVRQYSYLSQKWLLSFNLPENARKYPSAWFNIFAKEHSCALLPDEPSDRTEDLLPFIYGFSAVDGDDNEVTNMLQERCRGCAETLGDFDTDACVISCSTCRGKYHLGCLDPPMSRDRYQRMVRDSQKYVCPRCTICTGCYQNEIAFGSHPHPSPPSMLTIPNDDDLNLCFSCKKLYDSEHYCPNCAHTWDDNRFYLVEKQILDGGSASRRRKRSELIFTEDDLSMSLSFGNFESDETYFEEFKVEPRCYYPETEIWGFTENEMLLCDSCNVWVHAGCSGLNETEYNATSSGNHPIFSKEFLCFACCRKRCKKLIAGLQDEDRTLLFAIPVSERDAPNYYDLITEPMSLKQMEDKLESQHEVYSYEWVREDFELMCLNALTFNQYYTEIWREAKRFFQASLSHVFAKYGKAAPPSKYFAEISNRFKQAEIEIKKEEERIQVDETVEKKDLVAGSEAIVAAVQIPKLQTSPPDQPSCIPSTLIRMRKVDAFFCCWMDCCFTCGSSGASDCFLFCVDCGEAFHTFCVGAPIHSMESSSVSGWRCPNCKLCEISGDVPEDEKRMIYCEMCDRAFTLDLLDPPLISAPEGLWVCGQCVDCKICRNSAERGGASLKFWSQDPQKCFRCGGCTCLVQDYSASKCQICNVFLREDDGDYQHCTKCGSAVHFHCDKGRKISKYDDKRSKYQCPSCSRPASIPFADIAVQKDRDSLAKLAFDLVDQRILCEDRSISRCEHLDTLLHALDWQLRKEWIAEYTAIVNDAIKLYQTASTLGDPRFVIQQVLQRMHQLPPWLGHRALRFIQMVKTQRFDETPFSTDRADTAVVIAKLAAAFIEVASITLGTSKEKAVQYLNRMQSLILEPDDNGSVAYPADRLKEVSDEVSFEGNTLVLKPRAQSVHSEKKEETSDLIVDGAPVPDESLFIIAAPLSGWSPQVGEMMGVKEWKDPRKCCLCHICGDSDAGVQSQGSEKADKDLPAMGRLLPVGSEGHWIHASCAIWSSEVWEEGDSGRLHAVGKARGRGALLKCFGCGFSGATVGCNKGQCPFNYHFCCAGPSGAIFSSDRHVFCKAHKCAATDAAADNIEHMKALMIVPDKSEQEDFANQDFCTRIGSLVIHALGDIETKVDGFHSEDYIMPLGFVSSRIFWSTKRPRSRTTYVMKIERNADRMPLFTITSCEDAATTITASSANEAYAELCNKVEFINAPLFSQGDMLSKLPMIRKTRRKTYALNAPQFFGFGLDQVRRQLEILPNAEALVAPVSDSSQPYHFCFSYGPKNDPDNLKALARDLQRKRIAEKAELSLQNTSGCARCEGIKAVVKSGGSGRITRALVRSVEEDDDDEGTQPSFTKKAEEKAKAERNLVQVKYGAMKKIPIEQRLAPRRSHIHGWGLFTKRDIPKDDPVCEYMGEIIHKRVADKRESLYEKSGEGSCYMFRLDLERIVDATKIGCMARFMNHSCSPNAYAKSITVETESGPDKKIVVFALRDISTGEEITYDYKFPIEDGSIRCTCGAPNCIGRLN